MLIKHSRFTASHIHVLTPQIVKVNEEVLILLGDLLAVLASTDATRKLILHQKTENKHRLLYNVLFVYDCCVWM